MPARPPDPRMIDVSPSVEATVPSTRVVVPMVHAMSVQCVTLMSVFAPSNQLKMGRPSRPTVIDGNAFGNEEAPPGNDVIAVGPTTLRGSTSHCTVPSWRIERTPPTGQVPVTRFWITDGLTEKVVPASERPVPALYVVSWSACQEKPEPSNFRTCPADGAAAWSLPGSIEPSAISTACTHPVQFRSASAVATTWARVLPDSFLELGAIAMMFEGRRPFVHVATSTFPRLTRCVPHPTAWNPSTVSALIPALPATDAPAPGATMSPRTATATTSLSMPLGRIRPLPLPWRPLRRPARPKA